VHLGDVVLSRGRLLVRCFKVELRPLSSFSSEQGVVGRILRTFSLGVPGFGIEFLDPEHEPGERLGRIP
jgi:hypothetical protein